MILAIDVPKAEMATIQSLLTAEGFQVQEVSEDEAVDRVENDTEIDAVIQAVDSLPLDPKPKIAILCDSLDISFGALTDWDETRLYSIRAHRDPTELCQLIIKDTKQRNRPSGPKPEVQPRPLTIGGLIQNRLRTAMYGEMEEENCRWSKTGYDRHLSNLVSCVDSEGRFDELSAGGEAANSLALLDVASCILAARLTKFLIDNRDTRSARLLDVPELPATCENFSLRAEIDWNRLFSIVFGLVDFLPSNTQATIEKTEDEQWLRVSFDREIGFENGPHIKDGWAADYKTEIQEQLCNNNENSNRHTWKVSFDTDNKTELLLRRTT